jgi:hypothetical protein
MRNACEFVGVGVLVGGIALRLFASDIVWPAGLVHVSQDQGFHKHYKYYLREKALIDVSLFVMALGTGLTILTAWRRIVVSEEKRD